MRRLRILPVEARLPLLGLGLALFVMIVTAPPLRGQPPSPQPPPQTPPSQTPPPQQPPAQPAAPTARVFSSDAGMIFNTIKPDKTADFEMAMGKLKEALQKSDKPERKQQAASWKVFKSVEPGPNGNVLYIFIMDPAVKGADYTISKILSEAFPTEVQELFKVYSAAYASGQNMVNLQLVSDFGK
jgi:hypothetical protein